MEVDLGEALGHQIEQPGFGRAVDLRIKFEVLKDVAHRRGKGLDLGEQVFADVVLIAHQRLAVEGRRVVEALFGLAEQERFGIQPLLFLGGKLGQHGGFGGL
jgi:hypothetical protein